jgi:hypothetical protein
MDLNKVLQQFETSINMPSSGSTSLMPRINTLAGQLSRKLIDSAAPTTESIQMSTANNSGSSPQEALNLTITTVTTAEPSISVTTTSLVAAIWSYTLTSAAISTLIAIFATLFILGLLCMFYIYRNSICCACCINCRLFTSIQNRLGFQAAHSVRSQSVQASGVLAYGYGLSHGAQVNRQHSNPGTTNNQPPQSHPNGHQPHFQPQPQFQNRSTGPINSFKMTAPIKKDCSFEITQV